MISMNCWRANVPCSGAPLANHAQALPADPVNNDMVVQVWTPDGVQVFR